MKKLVSPLTSLFLLCTITPVTAVPDVSAEESYTWTFVKVEKAMFEKLADDDPNTLYFYTVQRSDQPLAYTSATSFETLAPIMSHFKVTKPGELAKKQFTCPYPEIPAALTQLIKHLKEDNTQSVRPISAK